MVGGLMVVIATPTRETVTAGFMGDTIKLLRRHPDARWVAPLGIYLPNLRQSAVFTALAVGASHILFIDSDMRFPEATLECLLSRDKAIVGANYVMRTMPSLWTANTENACVSSVGKTGLERVDVLGFGVVLIRTEVFRALERPWFETPYNGQIHVGEDVYFCQQAKAAGLPVWVDHDLSQQVRHHSLIEYGVESVEVESVA